MIQKDFIIFALLIYCEYKCPLTGVGSGKYDMGIAIWASNPEIDKKLKTMFNWILPTKGNTLYNILDNPSCKSQIIELDGRTVTIDITNVYDVNFGPRKY